MASVFEIGLANAVVATLLGAGTLLLGRRLKRPAVIHMLWILVLAKLITPPLVALPLPAWDVSSMTGIEEIDPSETEDRSPKVPPNTEHDEANHNPVEPADVALLPPGEEDPFENQTRTEAANSIAVGVAETNLASTADPLPQSIESSSTEESVATVGSLPESQTTDWAAILMQALMAVWILGSLGFVGLIAVRVRRFHRLLKQSAEDAPDDLQEELESLCDMLGLARPPRLVLVPGAVSPLLWAVGTRAMVVFPKSLLSHLDAAGRRSLLLHELTHLRRRDHWVRGLELVVGCVYWWLPLVWLARRELQQAEEECCDAWVVWWMDGERRPYAKALLTTLDFLAGTPDMPPAASGLGHLAFLKQRLQGILRADVPPSMSWRATVLTVLGSLLILPVFPTWGQNEPEPSPKPAEAAKDPSDGEANALESLAVRLAAQVGYQPAPAVDAVEFQAQPKRFPSIAEYAQGSVFSGDGRWLMTVYGRTHETGEVRIWDVAKKTERAKWKEPTGIRAVTMAPDGRTFAYGTYGGEIKLGDIETGQFKPAWEQKTKGVESLAFSADGKWLATGGSDGLAQVWDVATGKLVQTLTGHKGQIYGIAFAGDGGTLVTNGLDKTLKFWNRSTGQMIRSVQHPNQMFSLAVSSDGKLVATGCQDGNARIWDASTGELKLMMNPPRGAISVSFSPSGETLAASNGGGVTLWNVKTGASEAQFNANQEVVHHVAFSRDGKTLATTSWGRSVKLWNVETQAELATLMPAAAPDDELQPILGAAWSPDGSLVASVHEDKSIRIREGATGEVLAILTGHEDVVSDLKFSPDGKLLVTASNDHTLKLWQIRPETTAGEPKTIIAQKPLHTFEGHDNWVMCVAFSPDGTKVASGSYDRTIRIWNVREGKELKKLEGHTAAVRSLTFVSNDRLASGGSDRTIRIWNLADAREEAALKQHTGAVRALAYSPVTKILASASEDKSIKLWDMAQFNPKAPETPLLEPKNLAGHATMIWSLAFSPGGTVLASGDLSGQIKLWNPATGTERTTLKGHEDIVTALAFAPHGKSLLSGSFDARLYLWKGNSTRPVLTDITTLNLPKNRVRVAMFSPDGRWLVMGGGKQYTELRDLQNWKAKPVLIDQGKSTADLTFSLDSQFLAIGTYSGEIKLWDMRKKEWLPDLVGHEGQVQRVTFSPDGKKLASVGWDHVMKLWDLTEHKLIATSPKQPLLLSDVAFSPDGKTLATSSGNWKQWQTPGEVKLWSVEPLKELKTLGGHEQEIRGVAFTPKGDKLVSYSSSSKGTTQVWDVKTGKELGRFGGGAALTLLPGGRQAVTGDLYGKMRLWDLETFQPISEFTGHSDLVYTLSASPDGSLLASVCRDGAITLWPTRPALKPET